MNLKLITLLACLLGYSSIGYAASFDCTKAKAKIEKQICADDELSQLDTELMAAYKLYRAQLADEGKLQLKHAQRAWLKQRNKDCSDDTSACADIYQQRITQLLAQVSEGKQISAKDFYQHFNMRTIYSSYGQRLKYYCESYPQDFFTTPEFISATKLEMVEGDNIWTVSIAPDNRVTLGNQITSGTYHSVTSHRLYFDKNNNDWRTLQTFIAVPDDCVAYGTQDS
ncbi:lysozyme inhibitor LprI family protein [Shewanella fidelis]|uniref:lysozyme inhibitor LprI family protein n=1 Tax=Shewanella fidelis TaxID=173509 RepID=UPI0004B90B34|nr:lysozyme inhibitor LprI family protein [Shewanella fidelis]